MLHAFQRKYEGTYVCDADITHEKALKIDQIKFDVKLSLSFKAAKLHYV